MTTSTPQPAYSGAFNFAFVAFTQGSGQIDAGNISVVQNAPGNNGNNVVLTLDGHSEFFALDHGRIDNSNRGDYHIRAGGATNDAVNGVFIATVASNGVDWGFNDEMEYGTASIGYRDDQSLFVSVNNSRGSEYNTNISAAYFDFTKYTGAWVRNDGRGVVSAGANKDKIHVTKNADNTYTVTIDGVNSAEDGVLLVTGGENKAQYAAARALSDGSGWVIGVHNNAADGWAYENEDFGFTYLPKGDTKSTFGRVLSDGSTPVANGDFTLTKLGTGEYKLIVAGHTPADGALVLSAEGLDGANMDNVVSYAPSADGLGWIIQTRDFPTGQLEDAGLYTVPEGLEHMLDAVDPAFIGKSIDQIIASYENAQDNNVLVEAHRSNYFENGKIVRPENSMPAIDHAISLGADILELDFRRTSDGHWVVMHDDSVNRTTNGSGNVGNMTLAQIRALNLKNEGTGALTDEKVPTAEEVFAAVKGKAMIDMDKVPVSRFAELSALAVEAGVADQLIFKAAINNDADIAAVRAALDASAPGTHFMALLSPNTTPEFAAKVFAAIHPDAAEFQVNPPADGWSDEPGPFFTDEMKAVFAEYDVRMFMNIEFAGQGNGDGSMSGGRGDFVALTRPDLAYGYWVSQGVSILQTDELHIAVNYLNTFGYRTPVNGDGGTPGNDILVGTDAADEIHGGAGDDVIQGLGGSDKLYGDAGNDQILGWNDDDVIDGGDGDDVLIGNEGDDQVNGGDGADLIDGGEGDDVLTGGKGSDSYVYAAGYGSDTIVEAGGQSGDRDQLFLDDAARGDVVIHRHGSDIELQIGGETVTLKDQLAGGGVDVISFADGTTLIGDQIGAAAVNRGPVVTSPATATGNEDAPITGQILASDADGDQLTFALKNGFGPAHGIVSLDATGQWNYVPATNYNGSDSFTVVVIDGHGGTVEQVITLSVSPANDAPVVTAPAPATGDEDMPITGQVVASDTDGDQLSYLVKDGFGPAHGAVSLNAATGQWTYAPAANYNGSDSFTVVVSDGHGGTVEQVIGLTVTPANDGPVVTSPTTATGGEDTQITGQIVASDTDGDQLSYLVKDGFGPAHGAVLLDAATGQWTYDPTANYNGADHFTVIVSDGHGGTVEQVIDLTVTPVNDGPVAVDDIGSATESQTKLFDLAANDQDIDGNPLSLSGFTVEDVNGIALSPDAAKAAFAIVDGKLSFTPGSLFEGLNDGDTATVTLSYTVSDGTHTDTCSFTLTVNGEGEEQNVINGTPTSDVLLGTDGDDAIAAYAGADYVFARDGADVIDGGEGNDYIFGGVGNDVINGGEGSDTLFGDAGNDVLIGDKGNDRLTGGAGADTFMFRAGFGHDTIMDFGADDAIDLSTAEFSDFADLADHLADTALGTVLTLDDHSTLTLLNVDKAHLTADNFHFSA
jgi:VCBS repeat-containing protein